MKRKLFLFVVATVFAFYACDKKDSGGGGGTADDEKAVEQALEADFSDLTDEQHKDNLEAEGEAMLDAMEELAEEDAMEVLMSFAETMSTSSPLSPELATVVVSPLVNVTKAGNAHDILTSLKSTMEEEPTYSLMDEFNAVTYKFSWNAALMDWDVEDIDNAIVFEFPGKEGDLTNTAVITINQFQVQTITNPHPIFEDGGPGDVPTKLHADLKYSSTSLATFDYNGSFQSDGIPVSATANLQLGVFGFELAITHTPYTDASAKFTSKKGSEILIQLFVGAGGDWSEDNIEDNTEIVSDEWDEWEEVAFQNIIQNANAYIQIMGLKLAGMVDIQTLVDGINDIEEDVDDGLITEEDGMEDLVDLVNSEASLVLVYVADNTKIAEAELYYPKTYIDEYCYYDWYLGYDVCETDEYEAPGVYLVFSDGSKVDVETYFTENFEELQQDMIDMMEDLEEEYY